MNKEELKVLLKENLDISIYKTAISNPHRTYLPYDDDVVEVDIIFDGELIASSHITLNDIVGA